MLELRVLNGLHQGACLALGKESLTIGASLEADIEILDPGIESLHCEILYESNKDTWLLCPLEGECYVGLDSASVQKVSLEEGLIVKIGGVYVGFFHPDSIWDSQHLNPENQAFARRRKGRSLWFNNSKFYLPLILVSGCYFAYGVSDVKSDRKEDIVTTLQRDEEIPKADPVLMKNALLALNDMLRARTLQGKVTVVKQHYELELQGNVTQDEVEVIGRMVSRFSRIFPNQIVKNSVTLRNRTLPFDIKSVSSGMYAHIVTDTGERLYLGDSFRGYTLKDIDNQRILFSGLDDVEVRW